MCRLAGSGRKHDLFIRIHPLSLKDTSEYLGCHYSMHTRWFTKTWKSWFWVHFLALFPWKKTFFVQSGRKWPESHHMAGNGYLGYRGPILHRDSISKHVLKGFRENRKKSIFEILICGSPHYEYWNFNFPAKYRPYDIGSTFKHIRPLLKSKCMREQTFIWFLQRIMWFLEKSQKLWFLKYSRNCMSFLVFCC